MFESMSQANCFFRADIYPLVNSVHKRNFHLNAKKLIQTEMRQYEKTKLELLHKSLKLFFKIHFMADKRRKRQERRQNQNNYFYSDDNEEEEKHKIDETSDNQGAGDEVAGSKLSQRSPLGHTVEVTDVNQDTKDDNAVKSIALKNQEMTPVVECESPGQRGSLEQIGKQ